MTAPAETVLRSRLLRRVLSGDVEMGESEFGELGLWKPELLLMLPAWMLSLLGHTRDKLSDVQVGILEGAPTRNNNTDVCHCQVINLINGRKRCTHLL